GMDHPAADEIADLVGSKLGAGEHREHARHRLRGLGVDRLDLRVRVRRPQKMDIGLARPVDVVGVLALAGDKAEVFLAAHRRADTGRAHGGLLRQHLLYSVVGRSHSAACEWAPEPMALAPAAIALTML